MRNGAGEARLRFIKPQEPILVLEPPVSDDWIHEIKFDGLRTQLILDWAGARAFTRTGIDWSKRYWSSKHPQIAGAGDRIDRRFGNLIFTRGTFGFVAKLAH